VGDESADAAVRQLMARQPQLHAAAEECLQAITARRIHRRLSKNLLRVIPSGEAPVQVAPQAE
jgi:hypothetical protein